VRLLVLAALLLSGCGAALPVVIATSATAGFTATAYMPDSIERKRTP
jgi:hypothetical protein